MPGKAELSQSGRPKGRIQNIHELGWMSEVDGWALALIAQALNDGAGAIHVEPAEASVRVRMRLEGALREVQKLPKERQAPLTSCLKKLAGMDVGERRTPQEGGLVVEHEGQKFFLLANSIPTVWGEKIVLRVTPNRNPAPATLEGLGLSPHNLARLHSALARPHGLVMVSGLLGSGKTTTLYSMLRHFDNGERNLCSVEDPIKARLPGVQQVGLNARVGLSFASALRTLMRQDPEVILLGAIRDSETLTLALQAALERHLVLSSVYTLGAVSALVRLQEMGAEAYALATALRGVINQRLLRRLCPACRQAVPPDEGVELLLMLEQPPARLYRAEGCPECRFHGVSDQVAVHEVLLNDPELTQLLLKNAEAEALHPAAVRGGMIPLLLNARDHVLRGDISEAEFYRFKTSQL